MPNIRAAKKSMRQTKRRTARNQQVRDSLEIAIRFARKAAAVSSGDTKAKVMSAIKALDRAAQKGVIKQGNAARKKSRLMKLLKKAGKK